MNSIRKAIFVLLMPAVLTGCAPRITLRPPGELAAHREKFVREVNEGRAAISRSVVQRIVDEQEQALAAHSPPPSLDILILSGGDKGAFGAGVLEGWGSITNGEFQRPQFDVVTGVSTGALIAPYAFVGTDEAYKKAYFAYKEPKKEWFRLRNLLSILTLRGNSFIDNTGLCNEIKASMDDSLLHAISEGRRQNRVLLIGTTNLNLGMMTMWNATRLADEAVAGDRTMRETFDNVILASTAIPAVFPPVMIEGDYYVDGGVTRNIAYTTDQDFDQSAVNIWMREQPTRPLPRTRVWVIVNNQLCAPPEQLDVGWPAVVGRSLDLFIQSSTVNSLKSLAVSLAYLKLRTGLDIEMHFLAIPDDWRPPVEGPFKKETMNSLAELGRKLGADPSAWRTSVPNPESPEL